MHHILDFHALCYHLHTHGKWVWVDISGNAWKSRIDAARESLRLLRWLKSIGY